MLLWNVNGLRAGLLDLQSLVQYRNPASNNLQETYLRLSHTFNLRGFTTYCYYELDAERANGGTAALIKDCIYSCQSICSLHYGPFLSVLIYRVYHLRFVTSKCHRQYQ